MCIASTAAARAADSPADMVVVNANIITINLQQPRAQAMAVRDGRFIEVGSNESVRKLVGRQTKVIDVGYKTITPGFNDAHMHPRPLYDQDSVLSPVDLSPDSVRTIEELIRALQRKAEVTPLGQWIQGNRYQDTKLGRHPTRFDLDKASDKHPIRIVHSSGHLSVFNSHALDEAKITMATKDPPGGGFDRDAQGKPNGVCRESAVSVVLTAGTPRPEATPDEKIEGFLRQFREYVAKGLTSIQHAGTTLETGLLYSKAMDRGMPVRIYAMLRRAEIPALIERRREGRLNSDRLRFGGIKMFHGNSLSGRTCWLSKPYADRPDYYGIPPARSQEDLNKAILEIHSAGLQACVHSNGDREIDMLLNAYENALKVSPRENHRHRIEHCSVVNQEILERIKKLNVVLAPHSYIYEHGDKMEAYGTLRWDMMHPNGSAVAMGIPVAGTSDSPVSVADPMLRIQSMVTRTSAEGKVYGADQKVSAEQAIRIWTLGSAYAEFAEDRKGSIEKGKFADFVVLSGDPTTIPPLEIKDIRIEKTIIHGDIVFETGRSVVQAPSLPKRKRKILKVAAKLGRGPRKENSGIVKSRRYNDLFWMHNDSGNQPRIYPVRRNGQVHNSSRFARVSGVLIEGASNVDWEDITVDADGHVIVADVGNNSNLRRDLVLYYVDEPSPSAGRTTVKKRIHVRYPDQQQFPASTKNFNFDCEAVFTIGNQVHFLSKNRSDRSTNLYRLDDPRTDQTNTLMHVGSFDIQGQVVGADASPDGKQLVVITYRAIWLFERENDWIDFFHGQVSWMPYRSFQVEAVCFADDDTLLLADEFRGTLHEVRISDLTRIR